MLTRLLTAIFVVIVGAPGLSAQAPVVFSINAGIFKPVGGNVSSSHHFNERPLTINYLTREPYRNLYYNFNLAAYYPFAEWLNAGLETGFYLNDREKFFSDTVKTVTMFTTKAGAEFNVIKKNKLQFGFAAKAGLLIFKRSASNYTTHNGYVFSGAIFLKRKKEGSVRLGVEQQLQNVTIFIPATNSYKEINYPYTLKRIAIFISVCVDLPNIDF